ncbi:hypothetical protein P691DRAFT_782571 [Macrolepiota fuliginosa MF-IS2]|uniref:Uncharacterized protein n=1 Tax=Macrolepiota fuliginosa MF-IS2 TaxID=1400762 RepID=A0A9P5XCI3_9AGAR|nr:hypothetical protein P691DRAFT_782571 [Macrolepiota fuliginosa MF-IS2]
MKFTLATIVPVALAMSTLAEPVELDARQQQPAPAQCNMAGCLLTIASQIPGFIAPCEAAGANLQGIQQSQAQGQPPSQSDQFGLVANGAQCIALTIAAGFAIIHPERSCYPYPEELKKYDYD